MGPPDDRCVSAFAAGRGTASGIHAAASTSARGNHHFEATLVNRGVQETLGGSAIAGRTRGRACDSTSFPALCALLERKKSAGGSEHGIDDRGITAGAALRSVAALAGRRGSQDSDIAAGDPDPLQAVNGSDAPVTADGRRRGASVATPCETREVDAPHRRPQDASPDNALCSVDRADTEACVSSLGDERNFGVSGTRVRGRESRRSVSTQAAESPADGAPAVSRGGSLFQPQE